jgi:hypothetical protein
VLEYRNVNVPINLVEGERAKVKMRSDCWVYPRTNTNRRSIYACKHDVAPLFSVLGDDIPTKNHVSLVISALIESVDASVA